MNITLNDQQIALLKILVEEFENGQFELGNTTKEILNQIKNKLDEA